MNRAATVLTIVVALALLVGFSGAATAKNHPSHAKNHASHAKEDSSQTKQIPQALMPPASSVLLFELRARGVQIYTCQAKPDDATAFVWTFTAPEAALFNARDQVVGSHFAGPTWQGQDGSSVVGAVVARVDAPNKKAIPWLLLEAKAHSGSGALATITHIQRLNTSGGVAPSEGCDAGHAGAQARVPYEATYAFYYPAAPSA